MEKAFLEDKEIIVETALKGIEVSVGVYRKGNELVAFSPTEIVRKMIFWLWSQIFRKIPIEITAWISEEET